MSKEGSERCGDILQKRLCRVLTIPSIPYVVVQGFLHQTPKEKLP